MREEYIGRCLPLVAWELGLVTRHESGLSTPPPVAVVAARSYNRLSLLIPFPKEEEEGALVLPLSNDLSLQGPARREHTELYIHGSDAQRLEEVKRELAEVGRADKAWGFAA